MIVDPVQSAITAYKSVNDIFREDRLDKERREQQQFTNDLALDQNKRAQESHALQIEQVDKQKKLEVIQSLRFKLTEDPLSISADDFQILSQDPKLSRFIMNPELINQNLKATADLHADVPKLIDPKFDGKDASSIKERQKAKENTLANLTLLTKDRLLQNSENKDAKISDLLMHSNGLVIEGEFEKQDGSKVIRPLTAGASSGPDDPVNFYNIKDVMSNITGNAKMLAGLKTALEARGIELGDKTAIDRMDKREERQKIKAETDPIIESLKKSIPAGYENQVAMVEAAANTGRMGVADVLKSSLDIQKDYITKNNDTTEAIASLNTIKKYMEGSNNPKLKALGAAITEDSFKRPKTALTTIETLRKAIHDESMEEIRAKAEAAKANKPDRTEAAFDLQTRRDVSTRLREAMRGYNTALKSGDPDKVGAAINLIEDLNGDAKTVGVMPLNLPKRPATSDEISALQEQAISNLKEGRSAVGKFFNTSPSAAEVEAEVKRLKNQTQPQPQALTKIGNARLTYLEQKEATGRLNKDEAGQLSRLRQRAQATTKAPTQNNVMDMLPPASQHNGRITRDTVTGKRYQSIGGQWQEVR